MISFLAWTGGLFLIILASVLVALAGVWVVDLYRDIKNWQCLKNELIPVKSERDDLRKRVGELEAELETLRGMGPYRVNLPPPKG